ncbi:MFS transporter [Lentzea sp. NEAU-D7]|uniref:MFS transporter n=1 Tax=Lentzea sp. NEAU-D7 TaxID=2994667 RepID=UPI00224B9E2A|nr:MFS transporter [Lentzea sp. NEAU-D7]MCX2948680.1 MFS transporter [Lentzea sp. NEAU-D7]MCX2951238.1 MFS transporter [Lentzea sp. NEAU-D7]
MTTTSLREVLATGGPATVGVLAGLQVLDSVDGVMFVVFAPEIRESLGVSTATIGVVGALAGVMVALAALPLGLLGDRHRRTTIAGVATLVWAVAAGLLGLVQHLWQAVVLRVAAGIGKANEGPIQSSLLVDAYPPAGRGRVLGLHRGGQPLGIVTGPLLAAAFAALIPEEHEPWRWAFAFLAVPALLLGLAALRLPEPVRDHTTATPRGVLKELAKIRTFSGVVVSLGAFGVSVTTIPIYLNVILEEDLGQGAASRGVITAVCAAGGLLGATLGGFFSDRLFRRSPRACLHLAAGSLAVLGIGFAAQAHAPGVTTYVAVGVVTQAMTFAGIVPLSLVVASVTPKEFRATAFALVGVFTAVVGGLGGAVLTGVAEKLWGAQAAVAAVAPLASVVAGLVLIGTARHVPGDVARVVR